MPPIALPATPPVLFSYDDVIAAPAAYDCSGGDIRVLDNTGAIHVLRNIDGLHAQHIALMHQAAGHDDEAEAENRRLANELADAIAERGRRRRPAMGLWAVVGECAA